jgi:hypothetical protein
VSLLSSIHLCGENDNTARREKEKKRMREEKE